MILSEDTFEIKLNATDFLIVWEALDFMRVHIAEIQKKKFLQEVLQKLEKQVGLKQ